MRQITRREIIWIVILCITAVIVFTMNGGDDAAAESGRTLTASQAARVVARFRNVEPLPEPRQVAGAAIPERVRNIFRFGAAAPASGLEEKPEPDELKPEMTASETAVMNADSGADTGPPPVDFQVVGIIMGQGRKAAVITREPELFVVPEGAVFLGHYILKEVSRQELRIGFTGFDDTVTLSVEKNRGI